MREFTAISTNVCFLAFLCRKSTSEENMQNLFRFVQRRSNSNERYRRPKIVRFACSDLVTSRERLIRVAAEQRVIDFTKSWVAFHVRVASAHMPYETVEGSKSTCVGGQRLPVRSAQPRAMQNENISEDARDLLEKYRPRAAFEKMPCWGPP